MFLMSLLLSCFSLSSLTIVCCLLKYTHVCLIVPTLPYRFVGGSGRLWWLDWCVWISELSDSVTNTRTDKSTAQYIYIHTHTFWTLIAIMIIKAPNTCHLAYCYVHILISIVNVFISMQLLNTGGPCMAGSFKTKNFWF